ncbi:Retrovirus-related Pol polyprotein from transposon TNT 1-94 [Danaus plexippus plexippus]|uniref:Retrovirus-related Pol polyprotein from transposon TNT 1-94 n=1 Tax=Danaus plexippus plexippus TaxID=278856 RepID=A0A212EKG2_DANPL|nr:Retrovirus-related Pol polyprotein from transposon TNT 1-94 [Danaus plexippus plexippus]
MPAILKKKYLWEYVSGANSKPPPNDPNLPDSFAMVRMAINSRDDLSSTESLKVKIIEDFEGRKSQTVDQGAIYVKRINKNANLKKNYFSHGAKADVECYRCGRPGHLARVHSN